MLPVDLDGTTDIRLRPCVVFPLSDLGTIVSGTPNSIACWMARFKRYYCGNKNICQILYNHLSIIPSYSQLLIYIQSHIQHKPKWIPIVL